MQSLVLSDISSVYSKDIIFFIILSRFSNLTIDGFWIDNWIYWALPTVNYSSLQHALSFFGLLCCLFISPLVSASSGGRLRFPGFLSHSNY
jgi:hypothetical protein